MEATAPAQQPTSSPLRYRNRVIDEQALAEVRAIVEKTWDRSRREMALDLCREWGWRKVGGDWAEYACADLLRKLARRGDIELDPRRKVVPLFLQAFTSPFGFDLEAIGSIFAGMCSSRALRWLPGSLQ